MSLVGDTITAGYGQKAVVHEATCSVTGGKITALIGPNGAGKSTLLRCLARALPPSEGRVLLDDQDLYALPPRYAATRIGFIPQDNPVGFAFTVRELVELGAAAARREGTAPAPQRATEALRLLEIEPLADQSLLRLSGGERQRAALARALAQDTEYLLLDEPNTHLDLRHQIRLLQTLRAAARERGRGVLIVLHDLNLAATFADTLLLMHGGRVVARGAPREVLTPEILGPAYQTNVFVKRHPASGRPWVLAMPESAPPAGGGGAILPPPSVHLLCGGGTGTPLMAALHGAGIPLTAGVLSPLDTDAETAGALGIPYTEDIPFAPLSSEALEKDAALRRAARFVVVTDFPIGPGNLALLSAARESLDAGQRVLLLTDDASARDFTGGEGTRLYLSLREDGAGILEDPESLVAFVLDAS